MTYVNYLAIILTASILGYIISLLIKNSSVADVFWGLYFVLITDYLLFSSQSLNATKLTLAFMINVWGFRLSFYVLGKMIKTKKEDSRYADFRLKWGNKFNYRSLLQNFLLQAVLAFIIALPIIFVFQSQSNVLINWAVYIGFLIWLVGFIIETLADYQKSNFHKQKRGKDEFLSSGLWRYSRHPNYFGEIVSWWAIWLICFGLNVPVFTMLSPLLLSVLILFVSGIPLSEKRLKLNTKYQKYITVTSPIILWPPKNFK